MAKRSKLVTMLAWILVVLSGLGSFIVIIDIIVYLTTFVSSLADTLSYRRWSPSRGDPFGVFFVISVPIALIFVLSIGVLLNKRWAARGLVALFVILTLLIAGPLIYAWIQDFLYPLPCG